MLKRNIGIGKKIWKSNKISQEPKMNGDEESKIANFKAKAAKDFLL